MANPTDDFVPDTITERTFDRTHLTTNERLRYLERYCERLNQTISNLIDETCSPDVNMYPKYLDTPSLDNFIQEQIEQGK